MLRPHFVFVCGFLLSTFAHAENALTEALLNSKTSLDLRAFYFDRNFDKAGATDALAFTVGGIAKLETASFNGLQVGLAYYGNFLPGLTDRDKANGTSLLGKVGNDDIAFWGERYAKYAFGKNSIQLGRQRLATPLANDRELRLLPTTYRAGVVRSQELDETLLEAGVITGSSEFSSTANGISDSAALWGKDGLGYVYVENASLPKLKTRWQYAWALDQANIKVLDYRYIDARWSLTPDTSIEGQWAENRYEGAPASQVHGLTVVSKFRYADLGVVYNRIMHNAFRAINAGPLYTDWQQGYANYEPSQAWGAYVVLKPSADLAVRLGAVKVNAQEYSTRDDYIESMLDANYTFNQAHRLRLRYSIKNQSDRAYAANPTYPDRTDLRLIYSYSFSN